MKKTVFLFAWISCCFLSSFSQKTQKNPAMADPTGPEYALTEKVFRMALGYNDLNSATGALLKMMALSPGKVELKDTLCLIYYGRGYFDQCRIVAHEILTVNTEKPEILEALAVSEENLGLPKEAIADYEKLYLLTQKPFYLYQVASLQYNLKRYGESEANLALLLQNPETAKEKIVLAGGDGNREQVSLIAAAYNIFGVIKLDLKDAEAAKSFFEKALKEQPDFALAKSNLATISKPKAGN